MRNFSLNSSRYFPNCPVLGESSTISVCGIFKLLTRPARHGSDLPSIKQLNLNMEVVNAVEYLDVLELVDKVPVGGVGLTSKAQTCAGSQCI